VRAAETFAGLVTDVDVAGLPLPVAFTAAMDDDLATPAALAVVHDTVRAGNTALADGDKDGALGAALAIRAMTDVLGLDPLDPHWRGGATGTEQERLRAALDVLVRAELDARAAARAAGDYASADAIRARLSAAGIAVEDTTAGARWTVEGKR
jgi:cysteinyl-tRNA synthetase